MDFVRDWKTCIFIGPSRAKGPSLDWTPPPPLGIFKLNFDGSSLGNLGPSGFGCVIQDSKWEIIKTLAGPIGCANSTKAEAMGLLMGLRQIHDLQLHGSWVEGDSKVVVGWGCGLLLGFLEACPVY